MISLGLRFERSDARRLRAIAAQVSNGELNGQAIGTFTQAAAAAELGEPLILQCATPLEAVQVAAAYTLYGVTAPTIEELSGHRPA